MYFAVFLRETGSKELPSRRKRVFIGGLKLSVPESHRINVNDARGLLLTAGGELHPALKILFSSLSE